MAMSMQASRKESRKTPFQNKSQIISDRLQTVQHATSHDAAKPEAEPLWPHQVDAALKLQNYFDPNSPNTALVDPALVVLPSGCGKTGVAVLASYILCASRVLVITPDPIVSQQVHNHYKTFLLDRGIITKEEVNDFLPSITMISRSTQLHDVETLQSHVVITNIHKVGGRANVAVDEIDASKYDLVIVDEAHHYPKKSWRTFVDHFQKSRCLFLTSTLHDNKKEPIFAHVKPCYSLERQKAVKDGIIRDVEFDEIPLHTYNETYDEKHFLDIYKLIADKMERYLDEHDDEERRARRQTEELIADKMERYLDEHDNEERRARHQTEEVRHQTEEVRHQGMVLAPNKTEADKFCGIYNKYHKDEKCKVFVSGTPKRIYQDFIHKKIRVLVVVRRLLEGFDHKFVSVLGVICKINPASQVLFSHFVGRAVRRIYRKDPVKAHIVTHQYFNLRKNYEEFEQLAKEDPQGDMVTIYVLDDSLIKEAEDIKQFLESDYTIQMCPHTLDQYFLQNNSTSVLAAYQHYTQCSKVPCRVSNMTDMVNIRPFTDLVKLMPQSLSEFSDSEEFAKDEPLPAELSCLSEKYQMELSAKLCQLSEKYLKGLAKVHQPSEEELSTKLCQLSEECPKEVSAELDELSKECERELSATLCQLSEEYHKELKQLSENEIPAQQHQLSEEYQKQLSVKLHQLSKDYQEELSDKLLQRSEDCQKKLSDKLLQLSKEYQKEFSAKSPQYIEKSLEELHAELSQLTLQVESEASSHSATEQVVKQLPDIDTMSSADIIIILGHSSVFSCGPFDTEELLVVLTSKLNPTIIAFISCCGGNNRYGPIYKMSHLLTPKCLVAFYQRRVYVKELCKTSLVVGLRNYLYLQCELFKSVIKVTEEVNKCKRYAAIQAFGCAKLSLASNSSDPTVFINDCNMQNLAEIFCEMFKDTGDRIPLSALQLAIYHQIVLGSDMCPVSISMKSVIKADKVEELDKKCIAKIREHQIHEIVPLILELRLLKLYEDSLDCIRQGDPDSWKKVDHLQFLLAMLRGHWGLNNLTIIRKWATFHLMKMMSECDEDKMKDDTYLHKYKLCCICYVLLCEHHYVRFVEPGEDNHKFGILAYVRFFDFPSGHGSVWYESSDDMHSITCDGYTSNTKCLFKPHFLPTSHGKYPGRGELPHSWFDLFAKCCRTRYCAEMWNNGNPWRIKNSLFHGSKYPYVRFDFKLAMVALYEHLQHLAEHDPRILPIRSHCYGIKRFYNTNNSVQNAIQYFPRNEYTLYEMKVFINIWQMQQEQQIVQLYNYVARPDDTMQKIQEHTRNWYKLSACRFVFYATENPADGNEKIGILYFTDNHYGHNLIDFNKHGCSVDVLRDVELRCIGSKGQYKRTQETCYRYILRTLSESDLHKVLSLCLHCTNELKRRNLLHFNCNRQVLVTKLHQVRENCRGSVGKYRIEEETCHTYIRRHEKQSVLHKIRSLCRYCKYELQQLIIDEMKSGRTTLFPFKNIGRVTLRPETEEINIQIQNPL